MQMISNRTIKNVALQAINTHQQSVYGHNQLIKNLVRLYPENSIGRARAELFIHQQFALHHDADIQEFLPFLMTLESAGQISSGLGIRLAETAPLFVEQYLNSQIENVIKQEHSLSIQRHKLVEIGNLATAQKGLTKLLFIALTAYLEKTGIEWVVCNATPLVQNNFSRLGFQYFPLCKADKNRLVSGQKHWGNYYDTPSEVTLINVHQAYQCLVAKPRIFALLETMQPSIQNLNNRLSA